MTWNAYHRREAVLNEVAKLADRRRDGALLFHEADAEKAFDSYHGLLLAVQMRWHTRLAGRIDAELAEEPMNLELAVRRAWREATADLPGIRAILDTHDDHPALARARTKELAYLASASGLAGLADPEAPALGRKVRAEAQAIVLDRQVPADGEEGLMSRIWHALAA